MGWFAEEPVLNLCVFLCGRGVGKDSPLVEQFIARKADILFCPAWKTATIQEEEHLEEEDEAAGVCWFDPHLVHTKPSKLFILLRSVHTKTL